MSGAVLQGARAGVHDCGLRVLGQQLGNLLHEALQAVILPLQAENVQLQVPHQIDKCCYLCSASVAAFRPQDWRTIGIEILKQPVRRCMLSIYTLNDCWLRGQGCSP